VVEKALLIVSSTTKKSFAAKRLFLQMMIRFVCLPVQTVSVTPSGKTAPENAGSTALFPRTVTATGALPARLFQSPENNCT
jgi:hypothetical protein